MIRSRTKHSVKPKLEELEGRDLPSFLLFGGGVAGLEQPLAKVIDDMKAAGTDLSKQFQTITGTPVTIANIGQKEAAYGTAVADYQRIWNDHATVTAMGTADLAFVKAVAQAELTEGDPIDFILLNFGSLFNFRPLDSITNDMKTSDDFWNNGQLTGDLTTQINTNFNAVGTPPVMFLFTTQTIKQGAMKPTFAA
jgi:S-adenosylmethionine:tRNA-ribosyltransferase-isomerase (queuine synthetase)